MTRKSFVTGSGVNLTLSVLVDDSASRALPTKWSPTSLNTFIRCPLAYWFQTAQGWRAIPTEALSIGKLVHSVLEQLLGLPRLERSREVARNIFMVHWTAFTAEVDNGLDLNLMYRTAGEVMGRYFELEDPLQVHVLEDGLERQIEGTLGGVAIGGVIDRLEPGINGVRIVDYKTGKADPSHAGPNWRQQLLYAALYSDHDLDQESVTEVSLLFLGEPSRLMVRPVTPGAIARVTQDLVRAQEQREEFNQVSCWEARQSALCRYCAFTSVCPEKASRAPIPGSDQSNERLLKSKKARRSPRFENAKAPEMDST